MNYIPYIKYSFNITQSTLLYAVIDNETEQNEVPESSRRI